MTKDQWTPIGRLAASYDWAAGCVVQITDGTSESVVEIRPNAIHAPMMMRQAASKGLICQPERFRFAPEGAIPDAVLSAV